MWTALVGVIGVLVLVSLYVLSRSNYLVFHSVVEGFAIVVGFAIFVVAWNTRNWVSNDYLLFLGIAFLCVAIVDAFHTLAYSGMGVFPALGANEPTQLWILGRYIQAGALLAAPLYLTRRLRIGPAVGVFALITGIGMLSILYLDIFPAAFVQGEGLTTFKVASEYVISAVVLGGIVFLSRHRGSFEPQVFRLLVAAMCTTIAAEMAFTLYTDVYGVANMVGHLLKVVSYYLIYRAVVVTSLRTPYETLFRDLAHNRDLVQRERDLARNYVDAARVILLVLDREGRIQLINRKGVETVGCREQDILGENWFDRFIPVSERDRVRDVFQSLITGASDVAEQDETSLVDSRGDEHVVSWRNTVLRDGNGGIVGTLSSGEDITELKRAEAALRGSEEKFRALFEQSIDAIYIQPLDGSCPEANEAWLDLFGYTREELSSIDPTRDVCVDPRDHDDFLRRIERKGVVADEVRLKKKDGTFIYCQRSVVARTDGAGHIVALQGIIRDTSARRRAEEKVRRSEEQYRDLFEQSRDAIYLLEPDGSLLNMNEAAVRLSGYSRDRLLAMNFAGLFADPSSCPRVLAMVYAEDGLKDLPLKFRRKDGSVRDCEITAAIISSRDGGATVYQTLVRDVTERTSAEQQLKEFSRRLEHAMSAGNLAWWQMELPSGAVTFDERKAAMLGYSPSEFSHYQDFTRLLHPDEYEKAMQAMRDHLEGRAARYEVEYRIRTADEGYRWLRDVGSITAYDATGKPSTITGIVVDISDAKRAEERLAESNRELRDIAEHVDNAREEERAAIAWALHDEVAQAMSVIRLDVTTCYRQLPPQARELVGSAMERVLVLVDSTIARLRGLYTDLVPVMLQDLGLAAAIEWHVQQFAAQTGIDVSIGRVEHVTLSDERIALGLFRVMQQAVEHVTLLPGTSRVTVDFGLVDGHVELQVTGNGQARSPDSREGDRGLALAGIRERVLSWGGDVTVSVSPSQETVVQVTAPVRRE